MLQSKTVRKYDTYKDSGIEWIGEIPQEWKLVKTGRVFRNTKEIVGSNSANVERLALTLNGVIKRDKDDAEGLQPEQFDGYQYLRKNQMVFKLIDLENVNTSRVGLCPFEEGMVSPAYIVLKNNQSDNRYYHYYFLSLWHNEIFNHLGGDGVRSALNAKDLLNIPTFDLSNEIQQRIAEYLDKKCGEIDRVVETEKSVIEKLKEYKQSIITEAVTKGLDKSISLKYSGIEYLGNIPNNWNIKRLRYLATCQNGISKGGEFFGEGAPFVSYGDVYNNNVLPEIVSGLCMVTDAEKENYSVRENDIFFTRTSETIEEIAITCVCKKTIPDATFAGFLIRVRPYTDELLVDFSKYYFASEIHRKFFVKEMNLVIRASLSQELLKKLPVLIPPKEEQRQIAEYLDKKCSEIDKAIADKEQVIEKFTEYKKSLIYECVTGKRKVDG